MPSSSASPDPMPSRGPAPGEKAASSASPRAVALTLGAVVVVAFALPIFFAMRGEIERYRQVGALNVLWTQWGVESVLFVVGGLLALGMIRTSLMVAYRTRPFIVPLTEEDMLFENYRGAFDRYRRQVERVVPVLVSMFVGATAGGQWRKAVLWWHGTTFGADDPFYGKDAGFFVFTLPWLRFLTEFATMCLVLALLAGVAAHVVNGGIAVRGIVVEGGRRTTRAARVHLSILLAALFFVRAAAATLARYSLATDTGDRFAGMTYTAEHILEPAHAVLAVIAACVAGLFLSALRTDSLRIPVTGAVVFGVVSIGGLDVAVPLYDHLEVRQNVVRLEQVQARQAMTGQAEAFGLTHVRERALDVGEVPASRRADVSTVVSRIPAVGAGDGASEQASPARDGVSSGDVRARLERLAPWLTWDRHPYAVADGSRKLWVVDGYTTSSTYPGSEVYRFGALDQDGSGDASDASPQGIAVNYVRNSVKATVDERTGEITLYAWDPKEPVLRAWEGVFHPHLQPASRIPAGVSEKLRYPQDLFTAQRDVLTRYHSRSVADFLGGSSWQPSSDPDAQPAGVPAAPLYGPAGGGSDQGAVSSTGLSAAFVTGTSRPQLTAVLTGSGASGRTGLTLSTVPPADASQLPDPGAWSRGLRTSTMRAAGPPQTGQTLSDAVKQAEKRGSVSFGPVAVVQVGSGLVYAEQITSTAQAAGSRPQVLAVVLRSGRTTVWAASASKAVEALFAGEQSSSTRKGAIDDAQQALADANAAEARGDNEAYDEAAKRLQSALNRAESATK